MLESGLLPDQVLGASQAIARVREFVASQSATDAPVLLVGEPGTGKQETARTLHARSPRSAEPLIMIDCSLYYERELKRELFGYGGVGTREDRKGALEFVSRGTCYLSRIEELTAAIQTRLLSFLKAGKFCRLGDGKELSSRARLIVSSEKNLDGFVQAGLFDPELHAEFAAYSQVLPPLRERREDIPIIIAEMSKKFAEHRSAQSKPGTPVTGPEFTTDAIQALQAFPWPGNLDEFRKEMSRLLESDLQQVRVQDLRLEIASYWLGQSGDPETRRAIEELDGCIREFRVMSRIQGELGTGIFQRGNRLLDYETEITEGDGYY